MSKTIRERRAAIAIQVASAEGVADRWMSQYRDKSGEWRSTVSGPAQHIYERLAGLGANASPAEVAEIVGNKSWTHVSCDSCGEYADVGAALGEYEPKTFCEACLTEAVQRLKTVRGAAA